jgi:hypothetical protein
MYRPVAMGPAVAGRLFHAIHRTPSGVFRREFPAKRMQANRAGDSGEAADFHRIRSAATIVSGMLLPIAMTDSQDR